MRTVSRPLLVSLPPMTDDTGTPPPLAGRTALVTGAGSGFGRAISQRFALDGARVGLAELSAEAAEETRALIEADGGDALVIPTDVTDYGRHASRRASRDGPVGPARHHGQ